MGLFSWIARLLGPSTSTPRSPVQFSQARPLATQPPASKAPASAKAPKATRLNLDPGQFGPLNEDDVRRRARWSRGSLFTNPWFGRRDLIPPVTDERTLLIDRAMVGMGLLTPEQLAEIHEIGAKMDQLRPNLAQAAETANAAVELDAQERQRLKAQKKSEAAERKRRHAEAVALRRKTDIVFLGRGVSGGLSDRRANIEKLQRLQLPVLATPSDTAKALSISIGRLRWLAFHSEAAEITHYIRFTVPKKSGGVRELSAPHRDLAVAQGWILAHILEKVPAHHLAHGFVPGRSTLSNALPHIHRDTVVNMDLKDFFPSITFPRVKGIFQDLGYSPAVATILALLCTESPRRKVDYAGRALHVATGPRALPQGACTSPALSNLLARRLDARLAGVAAKLGFTYTRYADDLTFSASGESAAKTGYLMARVRHIVADENLTVNEEKTRVQRPGRRQSVTGIVVNEKPNVPRPARRRLRAILHQAARTGIEAQNRHNRDNFRAWLDGMIAYVQMASPECGNRLRADFLKLRL